MGTDPHDHRGLSLAAANRPDDLDRHLRIAELLDAGSTWPAN